MNLELRLILGKARIRGIGNVTFRAKLPGLSKKQT